MPSSPRAARRSRLRGRFRWQWLLFLAAGAGGLIALWHFTSLGQLTDPEQIADQMTALAESPWAPLTLALTYLSAAALMFPVSVLNLTVILALGPFWGVAYAWYGMLLSGSASFFTGRRFGQQRLASLESEKLHQALNAIRRGGLPGMIMLRVMPVAPYPVINLVLGAGNISIRVFLLGTMIGVLPTLSAVALLGVGLRELVTDPSPTVAAVLVGVVVVVAIVTWCLKRQAPGQPGDA